MKRILLPFIILTVIAVSAEHAFCQQVRRMTFDSSTTTILIEANVILTEEKGAVAVMIPINNKLPEGTPKADLKTKDVVMGINGKRVRTMKEFRDMYDVLKPKAEVKLAVKRGEDLFFVTFPKLDPEAMPKGVNVYGKTAVGTTGSGQRSITYSRREGYNAGGYTVNEKEGKVVIGELLVYKAQLLGDLDIAAEDRIVSLNGTPVESLSGFISSYQNVEAESAVTLEIERDGAVKTVSYKKPNSVTKSIQISK